MPTCHPRLQNTSKHLFPNRAPRALPAPVDLKPTDPLDPLSARLRASGGPSGGPAEICEAQADSDRGRVRVDCVSSLFDQIKCCVGVCLVFLYSESLCFTKQRRNTPSLTDEAAGARDLRKLFEELKFPVRRLRPGRGEDCAQSV